ncbi:MAG: NAD(+) synthase, partial [Myxococcales bacterium]|nr:NAD(+) synthase [Myxococcales bacterium]
MLRRAALPPELQRTLDELRRRRRFDVDTWLAAKIALLGAYLERSGIRAAVVGVSGGVDSALALALLRRIADATEGSLERLIAVLAPIHVDAGATNQDRALARGREVAGAFGAEVVEVELGDAHRAVKAATDAALGVVGDAWSSGQLVSTIRTPAFYYVTSLLAQEGWPALLCGTTNRDEGSYLGFFGKASDGMVDLQVISDLHKSEVYAAAARLGVPASVLEATPTGDTFDGRPDEAMIGAPYDFVELYTGLLALADRHARIALEAPWSADARARFDAWAAAVEALHAQNHHKYLAGANAIHVDVYPRHVPGGWSPPIDHTPPKGRFVGEFVADPPLLGELDHPPPSPRVRATPGFAGSLLTIEGLLSAAEAGRLRARARAQAQVAVGVHGVAAGHDPRRDPPGSTRASTHDPALAEALWRRLGPCLPPLRIVDARTPTDHEGHPVWRPVGVSPLLRFITYLPGASLVPHRDATFDL